MIDGDVLIQCDQGIQTLKATLGDEEESTSLQQGGEPTDILVSLSADRCFISTNSNSSTISCFSMLGK
jgi:hypothetical protein